MRFRTALILGALVVGLFAMPAGSAVSQAATKTYIVQMLADPVVAYDGGVAGIAATKPAKGQKINPNANNVRRYVDHLKGLHDSALGKVGGGQKLYDYVYSLNGFTARLTEAQAQGLKGLKGVVAVTEDELQTVATSSTPSFLGLDAPNGLWSQLGGTGVPSANPAPQTRGAGEGIVIFAWRFVCPFTKRKCSTIGWFSKSSLLFTRSMIGLSAAPLNCTPCSTK